MQCIAEIIKPFQYSTSICINTINILWRKGGNNSFITQIFDLHECLLFIESKKNWLPFDDKDDKSAE